MKLNVKHAKNELKKIIAPITPYTRCVVIYGSQSKKCKKNSTPESDIDFLIIFKNDVNSNKISLELEEELTHNPHSASGYCGLINL